MPTVEKRRRTGPPQKPGKTEFGRALRTAREAAGYTTITALAERMGWTVPQGAKLERIVADPCLSTVRRLVEEAGLPLEYFFGHDAILAAAERLREDAP